MFITDLDTIKNAPESSLLFNSFFNQDMHKVLTDENSTPFFDSDPSSFRFILHFLRRKNIPRNLSKLEKEMLAQEAEYFGIIELSDLLRNTMIERKLFDQESLIEYLSKFTSSPIILSKSDLSDLSISKMKFSNSTIRNCNLEGADCFETKFSGSIIEDSSFSHANLSLADFSNCKVLNNLDFSHSNSENILSFSSCFFSSCCC